ncbi:DUF417 family protein [Rothia sp. ZJ1223]|uniref:DUF417 family protein n=1 Tax=Rothia sp. ZJ1223 TaxID=2811098 RepID=UPI00351C4A69
MHQLLRIRALLLAGMSFVALLFLITPPHAWVPDLGGDNYGFPYLCRCRRTST